MSESKTKNASAKNSQKKSAKPKTVKASAKSATSKAVAVDVKKSGTVKTATKSDTIKAKASKKPASFTIANVKLTVQDIRALNSVVFKRQIDVTIISFILLMISLLCGWYIADKVFPEADYTLRSFWLVVVIIYISYSLLRVFFGGIITDRSYDEERSNVFVDKTLKINSKHIQTISDHSESRWDWTVIYDLEKTQTHIFCFLDKNQAVVIPRRSLPDRINYDDLYDRLNDYFIQSRES